MVSRCGEIVRTLVRLVLPALAAAIVATAQAASPRMADTKPALATVSKSANATAAAAPKIDTAQIIARVNQDLQVDLQATAAGWQHQLDRLDKELGRKNLRYAQLNGFRVELQQVRSAVENLQRHLDPRLDGVKAQLDALGPAPAAGQPPEPEQTALSRAELNYRLDLLASGQAAVNASNLRIDHLLNVIEDIRREKFAFTLLEPIPGVYAFDTWASLPVYVPWAARQVRGLVAAWWQNVSDHAQIARIAAEALLLCVLLWIAAWRGVRRLRRWPQPTEPPLWRRASVAAGVILLRALPVVVPIVFLYGMVATAQPLPDRVGWLFYLTAQSAVIVFAVVALATAVFAPAAPQWRLIPASDAGAARICGLLWLLAVVYSLTSLLYIITRLVRAPFALTIAVALPSSLITAGLLVAILRTPLGGEHEAAPLLRLLRAFRKPVWTVVAAIVACALTGYLPLARFLAQQLVVTGSILALVYLLLLWVDGLAQHLSEDGPIAGRWLGLERNQRKQLALPITLALKFAVLVLAVPLIMLQWGYTWSDIHEWVWQLFFQFHIGNTPVTLAALLAAIIVFALGFAAARLFQGWLDGHVLRPAGISDGARNSIRTGVGYLGIVIAALAAFSYAGFNLSSLAIVAGAFSVGIGFGLQTLVNNFVSGLILLAERPIRVGDLVVVAGEEGYVRKISVRSTEVETFDHANVIIPNSYFMAEKVKNWTFRNSVRRIAVTVGAAYGCDPRQVQAVLLKVARDNPEVLATPAPYVDLKEFAASSVNFTLYAFIDGITKPTKIVKTRTELSMAVFEAFAAAGIEIPVAQSDVTVRNIDWLREAVAAYTSRSPGQASGNGSAAAAPSPAVAE